MPQYRALPRPSQPVVAAPGPGRLALAAVLSACSLSSVRIYQAAALSPMRTPLAARETQRLGEEICCRLLPDSAPYSHAAIALVALFLGCAGMLH